MAEPSASPREVATTLFDALNRQDLDTAEALWDPDLIEDFVAVARFEGAAAARAFFSEVFGALPDFAIRITDLVSDDTHAVVQWELTGTFTGSPFRGIHATGRRLQLRGVDVMLIEQGRLAHNVIYYDGLAFTRQVGLLPTEGSAGDRALMTGFNAVTDLRARLPRR